MKRVLDLPPMTKEEYDSISRSIGPIGIVQHPNFYREDMPPPSILNYNPSGYGGLVKLQLEERLMVDYEHELQRLFSDIEKAGDSAEPGTPQKELYTPRLIEIIEQRRQANKDADVAWGYQQLREERNTLQREVNIQVEANKGQAKQIDELTARVSGLSAERATHLQQINTQADRLAQMTAERDTIKHDLEIREQMHKGCEESRAAIAGERDNLLKQISECRHRIKDLETDNEALANERDNALADTSNTARANEDHEATKMEYQALVAQSTLLAMKFNAAQQEILELKAFIFDLTRPIIEAEHERITTEVPPDTHNA